MHKTFLEDDHSLRGFTADEEARLAKLARSFLRNGVNAKLHMKRGFKENCPPAYLTFSDLPYGRFDSALVLTPEVTIRIALERLECHSAVILTGNGPYPLVVTSAAKWARQVRPLFDNAATEIATRTAVRDR